MNEEEAQERKFRIKQRTINRAVARSEYRGTFQINRGTIRAALVPGRGYNEQKGACEGFWILIPYA